MMLRWFASATLCVAVALPVAADTIEVSLGEGRTRTTALAYEIVGEGSLAVVLHGRSRGALDPILEAAGGWSRVYLDPPGVGDSAAPEWISTSDQVLDVVLAAIDRLAEGRRYVIAGQSYFGYLAQAVAERRAEQVRGVLAVCPVVVADAARRDLDPAVVITRDEALLGSLGDEEGAALRLLVVQDQAAVAEMRRAAAYHRRLDTAFYDRIKRQGYALSSRSATAPTAVPALIVLGRQDAVVGYRDGLPLVARYPRGTVVVLDGAGHDPAIERMPLFRALVLDWLARVAAEP